MKILQYVFSFFLLLIVVGCSNDPEEVINDFKKELDEVNEISQIKSAFESKGFKSVEEAAAYANSLIQDIKPISRAINEDDYVERISPEVMEVIESMKNIKVDTEASPETLRLQLKKIVQNSTLSPNSQEYNILMNSVDIAVEAIYYVMELEAPKATTRGFWGTAWKVVKCVAGNCRIRGIRCGWWCRSWYCHTTCYRYSIGNRFRWVERRLSRSCYFLLKHEKKHSDNDLLSINIHYNPTAC